MDQLPHLRKCKYSSGENLLHVTQKLNKIKSVTFKLVFVQKKFKLNQSNRLLLLILNL